MRRIGIVLALGALLLTGCWNRVEAEQVDYVLAVGIDIAADGEIALTIQTPSLEALKPQGGVSLEKVKTISVKGKTTFEAVRNYINVGGRKLFWGHTQVYLIGEEAAKAGVEKYIDFFSADPELRGTSRMAVVKGKAKDVVESKTQITSLPARYINELIVKTNLSGKSPSVAFADFNRMLAEPTGGQPYLPLMELMEQSEYEKKLAGLHTESSKGKEQSPLIYIGGTAVFKGTKLAGYLNERESRGLLWTKNTLKSAIVTVNCGDNCTAALELVGGAKSEIKTSMQGDSAIFRVKVRADVNLGERVGYVDLADEEQLKRLEKEFRKVVEAEIRAAFAKSVKFRSDIIAFGNDLEDKQPKVWLKVKEDWEERILPEAELQVEVEGTVRRTSRTLYSPWVKGRAR
jgi:spore germination protein KC